MQIIQSIQNRIYEVRGERVMLDRDLAALYETETKRLKEAVNRNIKRFPADFMFQLTKEEWEALRFQFETLEKQDNPLRSQIATSKGRGGNRYLPYAFTEQGVAMLSGVLNSDRAINMNIAIMRAFVELRRALLLQTDLKEQLRQIKERLGEHDAQLNQSCLSADRYMMQWKTCWTKKRRSANGKTGKGLGLGSKIPVK